MYDKVPKDFWKKSLKSTGVLFLLAAAVLFLFCFFRRDWESMWVALLWIPLLALPPKGTQFHYIWGAVVGPLYLIIAAALVLAGAPRETGPIFWGILGIGMCLLMTIHGFWSWRSYLNNRGPDLARTFMVTANEAPMRAGINLSMSIEDAVRSGHRRYMVGALQHIDPRKVPTDAMVPLMANIRNACELAPGDTLSLAYRGLAQDTLEAMQLRQEPSEEIEEAKDIFGWGKVNV